VGEALERRATAARESETGSAGGVQRRPHASLSRKRRRIPRRSRLPLASCRRYRPRSFPRRSERDSSGSARQGKRP
jgi:hypothetical protein